MTVRAAPELQVRLLDLQQIDTRVAQVAHAGRTLPQTAELTRLANEAEVLRRRSTERRGAIEDLRAELKRVESDVAVVQSRITRDATRLQGTASAKDAQGLEHELASLGRRQSDLEDLQLGVMERLEDEERKLGEVETEQSETSARIAELEAERATALTGLDAEAAELAARRQSLAAELPADLVELYERQRARYGIGAALLRRGVSGGSNVALTGSDLAAVRAAAPDEVFLDPESGCILVRTEESGL